MKGGRDGGREGVMKEEGGSGAGWREEGEKAMEGAMVVALHGPTD